jgi:hypothetical protein
MPRARSKKQKNQDTDVDSFIDAGGSTPAEKEGEATDEVKTFTTRFPKQLVDRIDDAIEEQIVGESRNQWLMKAAVEKLKREQR